MASPCFYFVVPTKHHHTHSNQVKYKNSDRPGSDLVSFFRSQIDDAPVTLMKIERPQLEGTGNYHSQ